VEDLHVLVVDTDATVRAVKGEESRVTDEIPTPSREIFDPSPFTLHS
jgi:hypothetical protein